MPHGGAARRATPVIADQEECLQSRRFDHAADTVPGVSLALRTGSMSASLACQGGGIGIGEVCAGKAEGWFATASRAWLQVEHFHRHGNAEVPP